MTKQETSNEGAEVVALVPWQHSLHRARRARRAFAPTGRADPRALAENDAAIAAAGPLEAYYAIKEVGLADAIPVLGVLSTDQIQTLFDLEAWRGDSLDVPDLLSWLEAFRVAGHGALVRAARSLDREALASLFRRRLLIAHVPKEDRSDPEPVPDWLADPPPEIEPLLQTPDGRFFVAARATDERDELYGEDSEVEEEDRKQVLGLVRDLYMDEDWEYAATVLRTALDDLGSALEEDAHRFRVGRIEDLGFPPVHRAVEVYAPLDPAALDVDAPEYPPLPEGRLPLVHAERLANGLLEAALAGLDRRTVARVEGDLLAVSNMALVADGVDAGDLDGVRAALDRGRAYLELGLGFGVPPAEREAVAAERLRRLHPQVLFRVGYTLTLRLAERARSLLRHPGLFGAGLAALGAADRGVAEALLQKRPAFGRALEPRLGDAGAPLDSTLEDQRRAFATPDDLDVAGAWVDELTAVAQALEARGLASDEVDDGALPEELAERDIDLRLATAGAQVLLGRPFALIPLSREDIETLVDGLGLAALEAPRFEASEAAIAACREGLEGAPAEAMAARTSRVLAELAESWFALVGQEAIDLRFVEGVLRR